MRRRIISNSRRLLLAAFWLAFATRLVVPPGFMPASLSEGGPIVLCPVGLPSGILPGSPHSHGEHERADELAWEHCPLGSLFDASMLVATLDLDRTSLQPVVPPSGAFDLFRTVSAPVYRSRAPPLLDTLV